MWKNSVAISKRFLSDTQNNDGVHLGKTAMNLVCSIMYFVLPWFGVKSAVKRDKGTIYFHKNGLRGFNILTLMYYVYG